MAWTVGKEALPELSEADVVLDDKARQLADLIRSSKHFIVFTGAGVSTSAGIPDFRGPEGQWTLQAQGRQRTTAAVSSLQAIPTATHMALVELQNQGILKYLVSQNCDGLHRRSGILPVRALSSPDTNCDTTSSADHAPSRTKYRRCTATTRAKCAKTAEGSTSAVSLHHTLYRPL